MSAAALPQILVERSDQTRIADSKGRTPLFYAAARNHANCVALLIDVRPEWLDVGDMAGDTALHVAACRGHHEVVKLLLESGATVTLSNHRGLTAAHVAADDTSLQLLLDFGTSFIWEEIEWAVGRQR